MAVGAKDVVLAAGKVRVYLAGKKGVLRDVGAARVLVQRKHQQPSDAHDNQEGREVGRYLEQALILPERQQRCLVC